MRTPYYQDDLVTLFHGDCLEVAEWRDADVLVTDPPYGLNAELAAGYTGKKPAGGHRRTSERPTWDETTAVRDAALKAWGDRRRSSVIRVQYASNHATKVGHPTPKPVSLMEEIINHAPPGLIADPFAGGGSTLMAAKHLGRRAVGIELSERFCEIAANRLSQGLLDFGAAS